MRRQISGQDVVSRPVESADIAGSPRAPHFWSRVSKPAETASGRERAAGTATRSGRARAILLALRPVHWAKNTLLFVPLLLGHHFTGESLASAGLAFIVFSLAASAVYLLNDLVDLESDRQHPTKCRRPIAAGDLPTRYAAWLILGLLATSLAISLSLLPAEFSGILALYIALTGLYSFVLKRMMVVDVIVLANLYTLRLLAGGYASGTRVSEWLVAFSMFMFVSLAFAKRYAELTRLAVHGHMPNKSRGYLVSDLGLIETLGSTSGYLSVLVLVLYINSDAVRLIYQRPTTLWLMCPLLLYWITRFWFIAKRGELNEDPVVFAFRDSTSLATAAIAAGLVGIASIY